jgi:hypothetical protein
MRNATQAAAWAEVRDGSTGWRTTCLTLVRQAWDLPMYDTYAQLEWDAVPLSARHSDTRPPVGAPCFWKGPTAQGHAAIVVEYRGDVPYVATTDVLRLGRVDVVPMRKIEQVWPSAHWLGWTSQLQGKVLPLPVPHAVVTRVVASPYRQGGKVYRSDLRFGQRGSDSVWNLQRALIRKGFQTGSPAPTGDYLSGTRAAVAAFQRSQGWAGRDADGLAGRFTVVRLGLIWVQD